MDWALKNKPNRVTTLLQAFKAARSFQGKCQHLHSNLSGSVWSDPSLPLQPVLNPPPELWEPDRGTLPVPVCCPSRSKCSSSTPFTCCTVILPLDLNNAFHTWPFSTKQVSPFLPHYIFRVAYLSYPLVVLIIALILYMSICNYLINQDMSLLLDFKFHEVRDHNVLLMTISLWHTVGNK